jgi:hypothetical protein
MDGFNSGDANEMFAQMFAEALRSQGSKKQGGNTSFQGITQLFFPFFLPGLQGGGAFDIPQYGMHGRGGPGGTPFVFNFPIGGNRFPGRGGQRDSAGLFVITRASGKARLTCVLLSLF